MQRRNTRQRTLILDILSTHTDHPSAETVYREVQEIDPKISRATVYRNLALLKETGQISCLAGPDGHRFDPCALDHAHITCEACGSIADVEMPYDEELDALAQRITGYARVHHGLMFCGICPDCRAKRQQSAEQ
ncbi:MAG: Fur family transcriptional regulator [Coriobacteriaceae bacterium]|nr:Fur family transcriptional regulator [Coriobacteriaceae bacterium]